MATVRSSLPHEERTAAEPRENRLEPVILSQIRQINDSIRTLRLRAVDPNHTINVRQNALLFPCKTTHANGLPVKFSPGQWLDTFIPGLDKAGGFTITSTPNEARPLPHSPPFLELAIQGSSNPPARWLSQPEDEIIGKQLIVRVGGSFTWPPPSLDAASIDRLVLVAAGVGINPLISIFSHLIKTGSRPREIHFLYGTKADSELDPQCILFLPRLMDLVAAEADPKATLKLFLTGTGTESAGPIEHGKLPNGTFPRRMNGPDLIKAIDGYGQAGSDRSSTVCYVCGPPRMTDETVKFLQSQRGMAKERVLCEKWW